MALVRVRQATQVTLTHTFLVGEVATDATGSVTVTVKRLDGTAVTSGAAGHAGIGQYTFTLPAQPLLDALTVDWAGTVAGNPLTDRDIVEVVGGFLFGIAEARNKPPALSTQVYPDAGLEAERVGVEQECEIICGQAFVPRFARIALSSRGTDALLLPVANVRAVRAVTVAGTAWSAPDVAALVPEDSGVLYRPGCVPWPAGRVILEVEHGWDYPPEGIRTAAMLRLRSSLGQFSSQVPQRAISFTVQDGGVYRLSTPSRDRTGVPDVDGPYARYTLDMGGFA